MTRLLIHVEGETEKGFVRTVLARNSIAMDSRQSVLDSWAVPVKVAEEAESRLGTQCGKISFIT